jgi:hypothetical protein
MEKVELTPSTIRTGKISKKNRWIDRKEILGRNRKSRYSSKEIKNDPVSGSRLEGWGSASHRHEIPLENCQEIIKQNN